MIFFFLGICEREREREREREVFIRILYYEAIMAGHLIVIPLIFKRNGYSLKMRNRLGSEGE